MAQYFQLNFILPKFNYQTIGLQTDTNFLSLYDDNFNKLGHFNLSILKNYLQIKDSNWEIHSFSAPGNTSESTYLSLSDTIDIIKEKIENGLYKDKKIFNIPVCLNSSFKIYINDKIYYPYKIDENNNYYLYESPNIIHTTPYIINPSNFYEQNFIKNNYETFNLILESEDNEIYYETFGSQDAGFYKKLTMDVSLHTINLEPPYKTNRIGKENNWFNLINKETDEIEKIYWIPSGNEEDAYYFSSNINDFEDEENLTSQDILIKQKFIPEDSDNTFLGLFEEENGLINYYNNIQLANHKTLYSKFLNNNEIEDDKENPKEEDVIEQFDKNHYFYFSSNLNKKIYWNYSVINGNKETLFFEEQDGEFIKFTPNVSLIPSEMPAELIKNGHSANEYEFVGFYTGRKNSGKKYFDKDLELLNYITNSTPLISTEENPTILYAGYGLIGVPDLEEEIEALPGIKAVEVGPYRAEEDASILKKDYYKIAASGNFDNISVNEEFRLGNNIVFKKILDGDETVLELSFEEDTSIGV